MKRRFPPLLALFLPLTVPALPAAEGSPGAPPETYAVVGVSLVRDNRLAELGWTEAQIDAFIGGVRAGFRGEAPVMDATAQALFAEIGQRMQAMAEADLKRKFGSAAFAQPGYLAEYTKTMRKQFSLDASDSGLSYGIKPGGSGARPAPEDTIVISYKVTKADARTEIPGLEVNNQRIRVADLPPGLREGFQLMTPGSIAMMIVPPDLSYGDGEWPAGTEPGTPLLYTMKLHEVITPP